MEMGKHRNAARCYRLAEAHNQLKLSLGREVGMVHNLVVCVGGGCEMSLDQDDDGRIR